jgi:hypothetical protein
MAQFLGAYLPRECILSRRSRPFFDTYRGLVQSMWWASRTCFRRWAAADRKTILHEFGCFKVCIKNSIKEGIAKLQFGAKSEASFAIPSKGFHFLAFLSMGSQRDGAVSKVPASLLPNDEKSGPRAEALKFSAN